MLITGTEGGDLLIGTLRRDAISGLGGADRLLGLDGDLDMLLKASLVQRGRRPAVCSQRSASATPATSGLSFAMPWGTDP